MRVRLAVDWVELVRYWCAAPAEACDGEVEGVPEEMNWARLAAVPAGELLEDRVRPVENPPEALNRVPIVGGVPVVRGERCRRRQPERRLANRDVDPEPAQSCVQRIVEGGDREPLDECELLGSTPIRPHDEAVLDKVEVDLEGHAVRRVHAARRQPANVDVERSMPPVVARSGRGHAHLADDLDP